MSRPAPRTIDEYLAALRAELAGQDPALIQDALYDASEYLRAEVAAHPGTPEAEVLERVMSTYGRPEEIAVAYRDTELTVTQALHSPASGRPSSPRQLDRFFAVYSDPRAYMSLFFMFLSLATGIVYFIFALTGLALSLGLAILIVGLPVFIAFLGIARVISLGEGRLLEAVSGERMPRRPAQLPARGGLWGRIRTMLRDARTWTTVGYLHLMLPLGVVYFVFATTALSLGVSLLLVPLVGIAQRLEWWPWAPQRIAISPAWLDTPAGWIACIICGPLVLTGLLHVARTVVAAHARVAKALLVS